MIIVYLILKKGVKKGKEFKIFYYASAAIRDYITICNIIFNNKTIFKIEKL